MQTPNLLLYDNSRTTVWKNMKQTQNILVKYKSTLQSKQTHQKHAYIKAYLCTKQPIRIPVVVCTKHNIDTVATW